MEPLACKEQLIALFYLTDEFCKDYLPGWYKLLLRSGAISRRRPSRLSVPEILTIFIHFHQSGYRTFKWYYEKYVLGDTYMHSCFPEAVSYNQFLELARANLIPLAHFLLFLISQSEKTGIYFVDSTSLEVCSNLRINRHKTFADLASRGKTSEGWFFGFKLHLVFNDRGELMAFRITPGHVADNDHDLVDRLTGGLFGKLFGDKGYISNRLFRRLWSRGLKLVTSIRRNMKNTLMSLVDKIFLRKRFIAETINDHLKNNEQIEHSRHRSLAGFLVNLFSGLTAYQLLPKKPSLNLGQKMKQLGC